MGRHPLLVLKAPLTAPRCGRPLQPNPPGMQRGFQGAPHPPQTHGRSHSIMSLCAPNRSLGAALRAPVQPQGPYPASVSSRAASSSDWWELHGNPAFPHPRGQPAAFIGGAEPLSPLPPPGAGQRAAPTAAHGKPEAHPFHPQCGSPGRTRSLSSGVPELSLHVAFPRTSMAVTSSERVYNPAAALGSLGRAGGRLGSRDCRSAGTRCCQHPDARVFRMLRSPRGCWDHHHMHPHGEEAQGLFLCLRSGKQMDRCPRHPPATSRVTQSAKELND